MKDFQSEGALLEAPPQIAPLKVGGHLAGACVMAAASVVFSLFCAATLAHGTENRYLIQLAFAGLTLAALAPSMASCLNRGRKSSLAWADGRSVEAREHAGRFCSA